MQWMFRQLIVASHKEKCYATPLNTEFPRRGDSTRRPQSGVGEGPESYFAESTGFSDDRSRSAKKHPAVVFAVQNGTCLSTDCSA
jgi:hypothetical protein